MGKLSSSLVGLEIKDGWAWFKIPMEFGIQHPNLSFIMPGLTAISKICIEKLDIFGTMAKGVLKKKDHTNCVFVLVQICHRT